jgi:hypothetical protein
MGLTLLFLLGCTDSESPPPQPDPADTTLSFPPLTQGEPVILTEGGEPRRTPVALSEPVTLWDARGDRAVLITEADPTTGLLLDLSDGQIMASIGRPGTVDWEAGLLSTRPAALVTLMDGRSVKPVVTIPEGTASESHLLVGEDGVFVLAQGAAGSVWYGPWSDTAEAAVSLSGRLGSMPRDMGWDARGRPEAWIARGVPGTAADGSCVRWRLDGPEPRCVAVDDPTPTAQRLELSEGWSVADAWGERVMLYRDSQPVPWRLDVECDWTLTAAMAEPPRVLAECQPSRDEPVRERRLWSLDGERSWQQSLPPSQRGMFRTRLVADPILFESIPATEPPLAVRWIDLRSLRGWSSPPLIPLRGDNLPDPVLARDPETGNVVLVDIESGSMHALSDAGEDCPVELVELMRAGDWVLLSCRQQMRSDYFSFQQHFAQLLDLKGRRSWRIEAMVEAVLAEGVVLVSDRETDLAEGSVAFGALEVWDLGAESDSPQNQQLFWR